MGWMMCLCLLTEGALAELLADDEAVRYPQAVSLRCGGGCHLVHSLLHGLLDLLEIGLHILLLGGARLLVWLLHYFI